MCAKYALFILFACLYVTDADAQRYFEFIVPRGDEPDEYFVAVTSDELVLAEVDSQLAKPMEERTRHINGAIGYGNGGFNFGSNYDWSWHFLPDEWIITDISAEVCDGWCGFVESDLVYWVETVGHFCPWTARVVREVFPTGIQCNRATVQKSISLYNYPNPYNARTVISYTLVHSDHVKLKVYDIHGREIQVVVDQPQEQGPHSVVFDARDLASGIYIFTLLTGNRIVASKKMLLVK